MNYIDKHRTDLNGYDDCSNDWIDYMSPAENEQYLLEKEFDSLGWFEEVRVLKYCWNERGNKKLRANAINSTIVELRAIKAIMNK